MRNLLCIAMAVAGLMTATSAEAATRPIQLSLVNPVQIFPETDSVKGVRLNLIYGVNQSMKGIDIGLANHTLGDGKGIQYGFFSFTEGDFTGWQNGTVAITKQRFTGVQTGFYTSAASGELFQWGAINVGGDVSGFQLGFINIADNLHGLQIGLVNVIKSKDSLPFFPIVNWKF